MIGFGPFRRPLRAVLQKTMYAVASHAFALRLFNRIYGLLQYRSRGWLHSRFAWMFREGVHTLAAGRWHVQLAGSELVLPLRPEHAWLDWDAALSVLGHEPEIKQTYETLLNGADRPDLFIDVGCNYGTHSLLFLVSGVETLSFEPNVACHEYFRTVCRLNGVVPRLYPLALGESHGRLELHYLERETWLGSLDTAVADRLKTRPGFRIEPVEVRRLDDFLHEIRGRRILLKIDAEDYEYSVLAGAKELLRRHRPMVLFEAHRLPRRELLFTLFEKAGYEIARLPIVRGERPSIVDRSVFMCEKGEDFIAIPSGCDSPYASQAKATERSTT